MSEGFVDRILADLRAFSPELLEAGATSAVRITSSVRGGGSISALLRAAADVAKLMPRLMQEARSTESELRADERLTRVPVGAMLSRNAAHYVSVDSGLLPQYWIRREPVVAPDLSAVRWIAHILVRLEAQVAHALSRIEKYREEMGGAGADSTVSAAHESEALGSMRGRLERAQYDVNRSRAILVQAAGARVVPSPSAPSPFPQSPAWLSLKRQARAILDPSMALRAGLKTLMAGEVETADVPYLYQRWCGVQLLEAFASLGWRVRGDPLGPLYLGGQIELHRDGARISLWVEAIITQSQANRTGYFCTRGLEARPDFLIVVPGPNGTDAFVLDATKTANDAVLRGKSKYLDVIASQALVLVAGVPVHRSPLRSWAAAPINRDRCDIHSPDGRSGVVPLHPLRESSRGLRDWVADIDAHAMAWSMRSASDG